MSDHLREAINAYLSTFDADVINMTPRQHDNRFPAGFIETFEEIFEAESAGEWTIVNDPELTLPKRIMERLFQTEKQNMIQANLDRMRASRDIQKEKNLQASKEKSKKFHADEHIRKQRVSPLMDEFGVLTISRKINNELAFHSLALVQSGSVLAQKQEEKS